MNESVLCGASAYDMKFYFNPDFSAIPQSVQDELRIICVLFTQEAGGVFLVVFDPDGEVSLIADADEEDITYDHVSAGLLVSEIRRKREDMFRSLSLYYRVKVLKEDPSILLTEDD
ncbi:MAG: DUF6145 family protein [Lachnospiraceae bacterium]|nr:DUF6145 family protein [Lachnospiraceae bacterium]